MLYHIGEWPYWNKEGGGILEHTYPLRRRRTRGLPPVLAEAQRHTRRAVTVEAAGRAVDRHFRGWESERPILGCNKRAFLTTVLLVLGPAAKCAQEDKT